ncbi:MAG: riboflavin biosynthesis protein RibF, partial [bacterium]
PLFAGQQVITTRPERDLIFAETGLDGAGTLDLVPSVTSLGHEVFVREVLLERLRARHLVVGWDFHYGHARVGNVSLLREQLETVPPPGCPVTMLDPVMEDSEPIKSTTIRRWLTSGELDKANAWLTRPYFCMGTVIEGRREGRQLGFPTANLALPPEKLRPAYGVYVTRAEVGGERYWAATNVGLRPTMTSDGLPTVEAHLLDFTGDLYGREITLHFLAYLRREERFPSLDALKQQIGRDVESVRAYAARKDP